MAKPRSLWGADMAVTNEDGNIWNMSSGKHGWIGLNWVNQWQLCGSHFGQAVDVWISRSVSCFAQADRLWYHENHMMHRIPHTTDSPAQNSQKCWRNPYKSYQIHSNPNSCDRFPGPLPWSQFPPRQAGSGRDFWQGLEAIKFWHHTHVSPKAEGFRDFWVHWKMHWNSWNMMRIECRLRTLVYYHIIRHSRIQYQRGISKLASLAQDPLQHQNKELPCGSCCPCNVIIGAFTSNPTTGT